MRWRGCFRARWMRRAGSWKAGSNRGSGDQDDLSPRISLQDLAMRPRCFGEREFLVDDRTQNPCFEGCADALMDGADLEVGGVHEGHPADVGVAGHRLSRVDLDAASIADDHDA